MADSAQAPGVEGEQATQEMPRVAGASTTGPSPAAAHAAAASGDAFSERPELFVGAAFAGGLVIAKVLKRLGR